MPAELAPGFLVAAPMLLDANFRRTVVLLVDHGPEGSLGFVVNRPAQVRLPGMLDALGLRASDLARAITFVAETPRGGYIANMELQPEAPLADKTDRQKLALGEEGMPS